MNNNNNQTLVINKIHKIHTNGSSWLEAVVYSVSAWNSVKSCEHAVTNGQMSPSILLKSSRYMLVRTWNNCTMILTGTTSSDLIRHRSRYGATTFHSCTEESMRQWVSE